MATSTYTGGSNACECTVAGSFTTFKGKGIISASVRANNNFSITECDVVMYGPTMGDISLSAYAPLTSAEKNSLRCPGRAGTSFEWVQKLACESDFTVYMIPSGRNKAYMEGGVTNKISMSYLTNCAPYQVVNASASNGPATPILNLVHRDGFNLSYTGGPIAVSPSHGDGPISVDFLSGGNNSFLPDGTILYLTSFSWEYTPPNIPIVNYSFIFSYIGCSAVGTSGKSKATTGQSSASISVLGNSNVNYGNNFSDSYTSSFNTYTARTQSVRSSFNSTYTSSRTGSARPVLNYQPDRERVY